jgi:hypothetical protein
MDIYIFRQTYNHATCKNTYEFKKRVFGILGICQIEFYEISGVPKAVAKVAMRIATYKMPIRTQFVIVISDKKMSDG